MKKRQRKKNAKKRAVELRQIIMQSIDKFMDSPTYFGVPMHLMRDTNEETSKKKECEESRQGVLGK